VSDQIEKMPKLQTACTTVISEGMIVPATTKKYARPASRWSSYCWATIRWIASLRCRRRVRTAGHDFSYGAAESKYMEAKNHTEDNMVAVVFFDRSALHSVLPAAYAFAAKAWTFGRSACRTAAVVRSSTQ